jgi:hypothetical protein
MREEAERIKKEFDKQWRDQQEHLRKVEREIGERIHREEQRRMREEERWVKMRLQREKDAQWHQEQARRGRGPGPMRPR